MLLFYSANRNPSLEDEEWPEYSKENPIYRIFNAEGDEKQPKENYGKGPMASACAFWNTYLPRLKTWAGKQTHRSFLLFFQRSSECVCVFFLIFDNASKFQSMFLMPVLLISDSN